MAKQLLIVLFVCVCLLGVNQPLWGQNAALQPIQGYLDPQTGVFHPFSQPVSSDAAPPATATFTGKIVVNFTITVSATIASTAKIQCTATAAVNDISSTGSNFINESATVLATRSGTSATCSATIPYSWTLVSGSTDKIMLGFQIMAPVQATGSAVLPARTSIQLGYATIPVPASGTTTTENLTPVF